LETRNQKPETRKKSENRILKPERRTLSGFGFSISGFLLVSGFWFLVLLPGCRRTGGMTSPTLTLYTAVDEPVARPIIEDFQKQTGIAVRLVPDSEASKTAGLADRLAAERSNPQADVWWSNEPFHTINLAEAGVLAEYDSPSAAQIPGIYKDPKHRWAGTALRIRVLAVAPSAAGKVTGIADLARPEFRGKIGMAKPAIGTVGGHVAALYVLWGDAKADAFFQSLKDNEIKLVGGNSVVADTVGRGQFLAGLTDNDDCENAQREGGKLEMVIPDQAPGGIGTLAIPCTAGLVAGAKHPEAARKLIDYLLSRDVEQKLQAAHFSKYSVFDPKPEARFMKVDYREAARSMPQAIQRAGNILEGR
jgi:iron(III) transport system substrate-binding protein